MTTTDTSLTRMGENLIRRMHLASKHALANALDPGLTDADLADIHTHEHDGPGTIRNHPRADSSYDLAEALVALGEGLEMDGKLRTITEQDYQDVGTLVQWTNEALPQLRRHGVDYPLMPEVVTRLGRSLGPWEG